MDIASTGMSAQSVRLNTTASNVANANSVSSSYDATYKARHPVFAAELRQASEQQGLGASGKTGLVPVAGAPILRLSEQFLQVRRLATPEYETARAHGSK